MTFSDFRCQTNHLFIKYIILKIRDIIKLQQLKIVYKFLNTSLPSDLTLFKLFKLNMMFMILLPETGLTYPQNLYINIQKQVF